MFKSVIEAVKDFVGINKYAVHYRFPKAHHINGWDGVGHHIPQRKNDAIHLAMHANKIIGDCTHWVQRVK